VVVLAKGLGDKLLDAQARGLTHDRRIDALDLKPLQAGVPDLPIAEIIVKATVKLTIEGPGTLELSLHDPDWLIEQSGVLMDRDGSDKRLRAVDVFLDGIAYRIVKASREDADVLDLTFEDRAAAVLRDNTKPRSWSRGSKTRAQAIEAMIAEERRYPVGYYSPEKGTKQTAAAPDRPSTTPARGDTGFDPGTSFKIKGVGAIGAQKRELATALGVADQEDATPRARVAMIAAGIGESSWTAIPNAGGSPYGGVLQGKYRSDSQGPKQFDIHDTEGMARCFLKGGKGFQGGGAIALAREHPDWSVGRIVLEVEGSLQNFGGDVARGTAFYQAHHDEAVKIADAWNGGTQSSSSDTVLRVKEYQFTRGIPGKRESTLDAAIRLAEEVSWRFFVAANVAAFVSDDYLLGSPALVVLEGIRDTGLLEPPTYDVDHGKVAQECTLRVDADAWSIGAGYVVVLRGDEFGLVEGRWITHTVEEDLKVATEPTTVTLVKPMAPRKEPAPDLIESTTSDDTTTGAGAGAARALSWAKSKLGHYKEDFGSNRGTELDRLEQKFHMVGEPWCAIFATSAVAQSGIGETAKTALVAQIRQWAQEGSHGYQKGFRAHAKPGDLLCLGTTHVALVEKVGSNGALTTIEGNTSANKVARLNSRNASDGALVRPDYLT
jgi:hypothetical protein